MSRSVRTMLLGRHWPASQFTCRRSVATFSATSVTPGSAARRRSISHTQAAQRMPSTENTPSVVSGSASSRASSGASRPASSEREAYSVRVS
jgi:hypothetical protein